jgi:hypothetical protein
VGGRLVFHLGKCDTSSADMTPTCKAKAAIRKISKFENEKFTFELRSITFFLGSI